MKTDSMNKIAGLVLLCCNIVAALTSCGNDPATDNGDTTPDGYGRLTITISTPEATQTRAVDTTTPWIEGTAAERAINSYHLLVCNGDNILDAISGNTIPLGNHEANPNNYYPSTETITTDLITTGTYDLTFYCLANFTAAMLAATGLTMDSNGLVTSTTLPTNFETKVMQPIANGISAVPATGLPMTGKLTQSGVSIVSGITSTISDPLILWRMMAKLEFQFTNESNSDVQVKGIEVEPVNQTSASNSGVFLISQDNLGSLNNLVPLFPNGATKTVSATWALNTSTLQTGASLSLGGIFSATELSLDGGENSKLDATKGLRTAGTASLYKFEAKEGGIGNSRDNAAVISFKVTPQNGMTFTPKNLSFKACRGGTNGGNFDVVTIINGTSTEVATGVRPERYSVSPYFSTYSYPINQSALTGETVVKIYVYGLSSGKDYAFGDLVISGDVTNNTGYGLQEHLTLPTAALTDVGTVTYTPSSVLTLTGKDDSSDSDEGTLFFYVNETDASFTTTENQFSVRIKLARQNGGSWYDDELRYGITTPYIDGQAGGNGFNVIRRNDWIHIPIHLTDWQFRIEPVPFVPIAGYPASTLSSDALTATFSTGGYIILQPFAQKNNDGTWRDFSDPEVTFVSLKWKNSDGTDVAGSGKIVESGFTYDGTNHRIVGALNNSLGAGTYKTTLTVNVKLGPSSGTQYSHAFTFNVILQK